jgi:pyridoxamine 5'-phosphate oxidase
VSGDERLSAMRVVYTGTQIDPASVPADPADLFRTWLAEAESGGLVAEPNAMVLASTGAGGRPHARTVLLKGLPADEHGETGLLVFTNLESAKARDLADDPAAAAVFGWHAISRQVRVEGTVREALPAASDAYFASRPRESQLGAWASRQSEEIDTRAALDARYEEMERRFEGREVERPPFWGGLVLQPDRWEFWVGHRGRLHDRVLYVAAADGWGWRRSRLQP